MTEGIAVGKEIGPDLFMYEDEKVLVYKDQEYLKPCGEFVTDLSEDNRSFCVRFVDHPGEYHEDALGNKKLRAEAAGDKDLSGFKVEHPVRLPEGVHILKTELRAAWDEFVKPVQLSGEPPTEGFRNLMGAFRSVYGGMPENEEIKG